MVSVLYLYAENYVAVSVMKQQSKWFWNGFTQWAIEPPSTQHFL